MFTNRKNSVGMIIVSVTLLFALYLVSYQPSLADKSIYTGKEKHDVSAQSAAKMTSNFQSAMGDKEIMAGYFGRGIYDKILAQKNCVGIRTYNARLENGSPTFVLVGVGADGKDIADGVIGEDIFPCPPWCARSPLNIAVQEIAMAKPVK